MTEIKFEGKIDQTMVSILVKHRHERLWWLHILGAAMLAVGVFLFFSKQIFAGAVLTLAFLLMEAWFWKICPRMIEKSIKKEMPQDFLSDNTTVSLTITENGVEIFSQKPDSFKITTKSNFDIIASCVLTKNHLEILLFDGQYYLFDLSGQSKEQLQNLLLFFKQKGKQYSLKAKVKTFI